MQSSYFAEIDQMIWHQWAIRGAIANTFFHLKPQWKEEIEECCQLLSFVDIVKFFTEELLYVGCPLHIKHRVYRHESAIIIGCLIQYVALLWRYPLARIWGMNWQLFSFGLELQILCDWKWSILVHSSQSSVWWFIFLSILVSSSVLVSFISVIPSGVGIPWHLLFLAFVIPFNALWNVFIFCLICQPLLFIVVLLFLWHRLISIGIEVFIELLSFIASIFMPVAIVIILVSVISAALLIVATITIIIIQRLIVRIRANSLEGSSCANTMLDLINRYGKQLVLRLERDTAANILGMYNIHIYLHPIAPVSPYRARMATEFIIPLWPIVVIFRLILVFLRFGLCPVQVPHGGI